MNKEEFEKMAKTTVSQDDFELISFAYTWYPTINDVDGKKQIVTLYNVGGMRLIRDMQATAKEAMEIEDEINGTKYRLLALERKLARLKK